jgi:hypothetical protein
MKVLIYSHAIAPNTGGVETVLMSAKEALASLQVALILIPEILCYPIEIIDGLSLLGGSRYAESG